jgi:hypothetical protein
MAALGRARRAVEQVPAGSTDSPAFRIELANYYYDLGGALTLRNDWEAAVRAYRQAADVLGRAGVGRASPPEQEKLGQTLKNLASLHSQRQRQGEAAENYGRAAAAYEAAVRMVPRSTAYRRGLAACYAAWADCERERGEFAAAVAVTERRRDVFSADAAALTAVARDFARIADRDPAGLPAAAADACRRAADAAVAALLAAAARGATDYARVRQEPVFARLRDRLPAVPPPATPGN